MNRMWLVYAGIVAVSLVWGANFGVSRWALDIFPPELFIFMRFGLAVPIFFLLLRWREGSVAVRAADLLPLALIGLVGVTGLELLVMYSIKFTTLANSSLLNVAPWPIFAALFSPFFTKEALTWRVVTGGAAALIGVAFIILGGGERLDFASENMLGNLLALAVSLCGALCNLACMPLMRKYSPLRVSSWYILFGVAGLIPFSWSQFGRVDWEVLSAVSYAAIAYNVLICTVAAFIIWNWGMNRIGATRANFYRYVVPAAAVLVGYLFFDESIFWPQVAGGLLMMAGLVWIGSDSKRVSAAPLEAVAR